MKVQNLFLLSVACLAGLWAMAGVTVPTFNLENVRARAFLKEVTYKSADASKVGRYDVSPPERRDQPAPVNLTWKPATGAASQVLCFSASAVFANADSVVLKGNAEGYDIYNLIPGKTYYYKVLSIDAAGKESETVSASFATEGTLRMIKAESGYNIRDLGGWSTCSGKKIRYGLIYRGAELSGKYQLTSADSAILHDIGIRAELDLRGNSEAEYITASRLGPDVEYNRIPTVTYDMEGIGAHNPRFGDQLKYVCDKVKNNEPVYFHCHIGADRTGCLGFLIEGLLGVSESDIYKEYELTTFSALRTGRYKNQIEDMMAYIKTFDGASLEEQFFSYCTQALGLDPVDIMEFKSTMLQYPFINTIDFGSDTITVNAGEQIDLLPSLLPENASRLNISYSISDPLVATVTTRGKLTGVRGGITVVTAKANVITQDVVIYVPYVESQMPQWVTYGDKDYEVLGPNLIENGSFEYAHPFTGWTTGIESPLSASNFALKEGTPWGDKYLQSLYGAEQESPRSLRALWKIEPGKTYIFGYKVRSSNGKAVTANPFLKTSLTNLKASGFTGGGDDFIWDDEDGAGARKFESTEVGIVAADDDDDEIFDYPSYDGQWTNVNYVFTNSKGYQYCQIIFSQLSDGNSHTCLDNFFLAELGEGEPTGIEEVQSRLTQDSGVNSQLSTGKYIYDLQGRKVNSQSSILNPQLPKGLYIQNKKTYKAR